MTQKSPVSVLLLSLVTCGIYQLIWVINTKGEMVQRGADIPTSWFLIIPGLNIWYIWKWATGVEHVTKGAMTGVVALLLIWFLGPIGAMIIQGKFNEVR